MDTIEDATKVFVSPISFGIIYTCIFSIISIHHNIIGDVVQKTTLWFDWRLNDVYKAFNA